MLIYCIKRIIDGKVVYVGQTKRTLRDRIYGHKRSIKTQKTILSDAFRKYGFENFEFEILEDNIVSFEELSRLEAYYIDLYKTFPCGSGAYNMTSGGERYLEITPEFRVKLSVIQNERYSNPQEREKTGKIMKEIFKNNPEILLTKSIKGKERYLDPKERIKTGLATKQAFELDPSINIRKGQKTKQRYIDNPELREQQSIISKTDIRYINGRAKAKESRSVKVRCIETGIVFSSLTDAANFAGVKYPSIIKSIKESRKCKGYTFEYLEKENILIETKSILSQLAESGYQAAIAIATQAEIEAGSACGQLSIITEKEGE